MTHGSARPIELHFVEKQIGRTFGKKFFGPDHSGLMFQPNVGMPAAASFFAPVNSSAASKTAYTWSWLSIASVSFRLFTVWSSRSLASTSLRPQTPPFELTTSKYALIPSFSRPLSPPIGFVFDVIEPTRICVEVTPGASTGTSFVKVWPENVVTVPPPAVVLVAVLEPALLHALDASASVVSKIGATARPVRTSETRRSVV